MLGWVRLVGVLGVALRTRAHARQAAHEVGPLPRGEAVARCACHRRGQTSRRSSTGWGSASARSGNFQAALAAWSRVDPHSSWSVPAGLARAGTLVADLGRFSDAETLLESLMRNPGAARDEVRHTLSELYFWEGRRGAMRRLLERDYRLAADPVLELRNHWRIDDAVTLVEKVRWEVRSGIKAGTGRRPGLADAGEPGDASRPIRGGPRIGSTAACKGGRLIRPSGEAGSTGRAPPATWPRRAVPWRLFPPEELTETERLELRGWLASRIGNAQAERDALERLVTIVHDSAAFERLAVLALGCRPSRACTGPPRPQGRARSSQGPLPPVDGGTDRAGALRRAGRVWPNHSAADFEAQGWWLLRARFAPSDRAASHAISRLAETIDPAPEGAHGMLADLLLDLDPELKSASNRPRTTHPPPGGAVPRFVDLAAPPACDSYLTTGTLDSGQIPETMAGGVALFDYDGDGWLDVYVVQGGVFPPRPDRPNTGDRLFRNRGDGTFEDASDQSGISRMKRGFGHGVTVGDIDNDGHPDLFITRWRAYALYHNRGDGTFDDITERAGLAGDRDWPTSAAFADLDNDGDLDLYVCHYLAWDADHPTLCPRKTRPAAQDQVEPEEQFSYCTPRPFTALPDHLFRNDGGRFVDVTTAASIVDHNGRGLGVVAADFDEDGLVDLFVANDTSANYLWHNLGGMKFEEAAVASGVACSAEGAFQAGMGTACGDADGDGLPDLFVTNFYGESTTYFHNLGSGAFTDQTVALGVAAPSRFLLGFGIALLDADNDGRLDLATANGHVNDDRPKYPYQMPASLFLGGKDGRMTDVTAAAGEPWIVPRLGRGLAVGDLDNDGRIDVVLLPAQSRPGLLPQPDSRQSCGFVRAGRHAAPIAKRSGRWSRSRPPAAAGGSGGAAAEATSRHQGRAFTSASATTASNRSRFTGPLAGSTVTAPSRPTGAISSVRARPNLCCCGAFRLDEQRPTCF